jgi:hypothetical protein
VNIIERLEALHDSLLGADAVELQNIIEEYKATEQEPVGWYEFGESTYPQSGLYGSCVDNLNKDGGKLFTHPQLSDETVKDAARYRWLRDVANVGSHHPMVCEDSFNLCIELINGIELDSRVDEAMKADNVPE